MDLVSEIQTELQKLGNPTRAKHSLRFFKTGPGEYGEGDVFIGNTVPQMRGIAKRYIEKVDLNTVLNLLHSPIHEYRMTALFLLTHMYQKADQAEKKLFVDFYIENLEWINNWDLVDCSTHKILGDYLRDKKDKKILRKLAKSGHLWSERAAVVANWTIMKENDFTEMLWLAKYFLHHEHDLMHKAVGWMLRELGKRDETVLKEFLDEHVTDMPRTMLRYAIEKFDEQTRKYYLQKK